MEKDKKEDKDIDFEKEMKELEQIANKLEEGKLTLDESVNKFEEGMKISKECNDYLKNAEQRITKIIVDNGEIKEENFIQED